jgi:hypothetical protein
VNAEAGGAAQIALAMIRTLDGDGGIFTAEQLDAACARRAAVTRCARALEAFSDALGAGG